MNCIATIENLAFGKAFAALCGRMIKNQLFTITEASREAGVQRSTVQRWIKCGQLKKQAGGQVKWNDVVRCLERHRTGRPHGQPAEAEARFVSEAEQSLAQPFIQGRIGLRRLKTMLSLITKYHVAGGRKNQLYQILTGAGREIIRQEKNISESKAETRRKKEIRKQNLLREKGKTLAQIGEMYERELIGDPAMLKRWNDRDAEYERAQAAGARAGAGG